MNDPDKKLDKTAAKNAKKAAKARVMAAKKAAEAEPTTSSPPGPPTSHPEHSGSDSPAERSARAAEKKVLLERWRTILAAIATLAALITALFALRNGC